MDKFSFLNTIAIITVFVMLLFSFFLLTVPRKNRLPNFLFASFLFLTAFDLSGFFCYNYFDVSLDFDVFRMTTSLLIMPIYYLYVKSVCLSDFRVRPKDLLHSGAFIISNLVFMPRFYFGSAIQRNNVLQHFDKIGEVQFFQIISEVQYVFYIVLVFLLLKKYKEIYLENYTNAADSSYKWLFQMTVFFLIAHCVFLIKSFLKYTEYHLLFEWSNVIIGILAMLISCWFVLKALNNPNLFKGIDSEMVLVSEALNTEVQKTTAETNTVDAIALQIQFLKEYVTKQEPFLDPSLTIQQLAKQVNMPVRDLSILINHHMKQHFFDFVNEYRIQKAMQLLKDHTKEKLTILEILYEVGFNSKSSFNTAFKKQTNQTPTAFRNS